MAITPAPVQAPALPLPTLTANDRCDTKACGAQAYVLVTLNNGSLLFCGHHYVARKLELDVAAKSIVDEMSFILPATPMTVSSAFA